MAKENKQKKEKYQILKKPFENWFLERYTKFLNELRYENYPVDLLTALNISQKKFDEIYIKPFRELNERHLELVLKSLCANLKEEISSSDYSYILCKQPRTGRQLNALQWLLVQIKDLNLFELPNNVLKYYKESYNQCLYCGKPDYYIKKNQRILFNNKNHFCHKDKCIISEADLSSHDNECHYKKWRQTKKNLNQNLSRNATYYNGEIAHDINVNNKLIRTFLDFCEKQYQKNLKIEYTIQYWAEIPGYPETRQFIKALHYSELLC